MYVAEIDALFVRLENSPKYSLSQKRANELWLTKHENERDER